MMRGALRYIRRNPSLSVGIALLGALSIFIFAGHLLVDTEDARPLSVPTLRPFSGVSMKSIDFSRFPVRSHQSPDGRMLPMRRIGKFAAELELILELQTDEYWQDVTAAMLETVRRRLRDLVKLIERAGPGKWDQRLN